MAFFLRGGLAAGAIGRAHGVARAVVALMGT